MNRGKNVGLVRYEFSTNDTNIITHKKETKVHITTLSVQVAVRETRDSVKFIIRLSFISVNHCLLNRRRLLFLNNFLPVSKFGEIYFCKKVVPVTVDDDQVKT